MEESYDERPVVIDNGSNTMKAGFAGDPLPLIMFPCVIVNLRDPSCWYGMGMGSKDHYAGQLAFEKFESFPTGLYLSYPIQNGIFKNWDDMEKIYHHTFYNELRVAPEEHAVMLTEKLNTPKSHREKLTQIMFETFNCPLIYIANDAMLSLYSTGKSTGISLDIGEQVCHSVPVYEGYAMLPGHCSLELGGTDLTDRMQTLLEKKGHSFTTGEREVVKNIKEKYAFMSTNSETFDISQDHKTNEKGDYELPDGKHITIDSSDAMNCCEPLFYPCLQKWSWSKASEVVIATTELPHDLLSIMGSYCGLGLDPVHGIHEMVFNSSKCDDEEIKQDLLSSIVLSGATSELPNLGERMQTELNQLFSETQHKPEVLADAPGTRNFRVFRGGSMLASSSIMDDRWITMEMYDECGPTNVHRRCL